MTGKFGRIRNEKQCVRLSVYLSLDARDRVKRQHPEMSFSGALEAVIMAHTAEPFVLCADGLYRLADAVGQS